MKPPRRRRQPSSTASPAWKRAPFRRSPARYRLPLPLPGLSAHRPGWPQESGPPQCLVIGAGTTIMDSLDLYYWKDGRELSLGPGLFVGPP